ncbi:MAG: binary toxin-like calcium binding domain-containing protein [Patescibacteria group bacterium]
MFDEQTQPQATPPIPQSSKQEPQDIFSEVPGLQASSSQPQIPGQVAGMQQSYPQEPHSGFNPKLILIVVAILAVLVVAAFGVQFALRSKQTSQQQPVAVQQAPVQPPVQEVSEPQTPPPGLIQDNQQPIPPTPPDQLAVPSALPTTPTPGEALVPLTQSATDTDGDGLLDDEELQLGTDPAKSDSDSDGLADGQEVKTYKTNPVVADSDSDGLDDSKELTVYKSDPLNPDTDGDGYLDGSEVSNGYSPLGPGALTAPMQ